MGNPTSPHMNSVIELPFNRLLDLQIADDPAKVLRLPAGGQYLNHLGTVHASAQLALAEASSGEFLLRAIGDMAGIVPVVRRMESKFRKPAHGELTSTASAPEGIEGLRSELEAKGRALVTIQVELHDEAGAHTLSAAVEWFITRVAEK
jgi:acyl-coenzyme A thioesterase PaaI-like protein